MNSSPVSLQVTTPTKVTELGMFKLVFHQKLAASNWPMKLSRRQENACSVAIIITSLLIMTLED